MILCVFLSIFVVFFYSTMKLMLLIEEVEIVLCDCVTDKIRVT